MNRLLVVVKKYIPQGMYRWFQPAYHFGLAFFAALTYGFPSRRLTVIGVTGTKGKTSVVELLHEILLEGGIRVASISSLRFKVLGKETPNILKMTMPGRFFIQRFMHEARKAGCTHVVLEVTSEGIRQFRHRCIDFDVAVFTNCAPEHIESHGSFERYIRAKLDLFWRLPRSGHAIINGDDSYQQRFRAATSGRVISYGRGGIMYDGNLIPIRGIEIGKSGIVFEAGTHTISSRLTGEFNFYNLCTALAIGIDMHISFEHMQNAIARVSGIPGRMEYLLREPFTVVVDYAHTPDSLRNVYETLRNENSKFQIPNSKLICVLGATGGGRDRWKRPEFGKIAAEFCGEIILTNEDPYDENLQTILENIESGFLSKYKIQNTNYKKILDRREAIQAALQSARPGDTVVITGKGAEPWIMGPNGTKILWDDRAVVREELAKLAIRLHCT